MPSLGIEAGLELQEPRLYYKYAVLKGKLLTEVYTRWAQGFPEGNDHGPEHIKRVLEKLDQLVGPNPIGTSIRPYELYLAMMSILYHDIGILRGRKNHPDEASNELGKKISGTPFFELDNDNNLFDLFDRDVIRAAVVSHSSSKDIERECQAFPHEFAIGVHVVRPRFIAALVRLADELDEDYRRAPQFTQQLTQLPKGSRFYWRFCQRISGIRAERDQHMIVIDAKLEMADVDYMVEVNENEQLFTSAFANKLAKINEERRYTNQFLTPAYTYSRILVSLRPPDNHPTWVSPKEFFFADGTSSADFLNAFPELRTERSIKSADNEQKVLQALMDLTPTPRSIYDIAKDTQLPVSLQLDNPKRREWIKSCVIDALISNKEDGLEAVHSRLSPPLQQDEKHFIIGVLVSESQSSEVENMRFLKFLDAYKFVEYFRNDLDGQGTYTADQGDRLLQRVLESCSNNDPEVRKESTFALRSFGGRSRIPISSMGSSKLAKALTALAEDEDLSVVRWGLPALGDQAWNIPQQFHEQIRDIIEKNLQHSNAEIRAAATWT